MTLTELQIQQSKDLAKIARDVEGIEEVETLYASIPSEEYKIFMLVDREQIDNAVNALLALKAQLKPNEDGLRQHCLVINNANPNPPIYTDDEMKNAVIENFKTLLPDLSNAQATAWSIKLAELNA